MNAIFHPEIFHEPKKSYQKNYFEGWYFKHTSPDLNISFIPGIHIENGIAKAFIQVITNTNSYYISYAFSEFSYSQSPFQIRIANSLFCLKECLLDIQDISQNILIKGKLTYTTPKYLHTSSFSPNIMGPFSYFPNMECNHAVLQMQNTTQGHLEINHKNYCFSNGIGYIEKDWGTSFPQSYIWCQANHFPQTNTSFFLSIASIPMSFFEFTGFICSFLYQEKEYRFATYNGSKILRYEVDKNHLVISLKRKNLILHVKSKLSQSLVLKAPQKGQMAKDINETIQANLTITLEQNHHILFSQSSSDCGLEIALH